MGNVLQRAFALCTEPLGGTQQDSRKVTSSQAVATPHFLSEDQKGGVTHPTLSNKNPRKAGARFRIGNQDGNPYRSGNRRCLR